jgi:hypothetical protein
MIAKIGDGYFAEVEAAGYGLHLVCVETGAGIAANVYSHKDDRWADLPQFVHNFDEAKSAATARASVLLRHIAKLNLPTPEWKPIR